MVEIGGRPILWHIMQHYSSYGFNEFVLALGYRGEQIKRYMVDYCKLTSSLTSNSAPATSCDTPATKKRSGPLT